MERDKVGDENDPTATHIATPGKPRPAAGVEKGQWNHAIIVLGVPGCGKSTYALARLIQLCQTPAYGLAHDPGWRLPAKLPDGMPDPKLHRHETIEAGRAAIARDGSGVHAFAVADGQEVLAFGRALSEASLAKGGGDRGTPVVVLLDEGVATESASPYRLGGPMREGLALRRHRHMAIIMTAQDPRLIHYAMVGLSTEIVMFRLRDDRALAELERMGVPSETTARLRGLPNYHYIVQKLG